jgi:hypothetical protein
MTDERASHSTEQAGMRRSRFLRLYAPPLAVGGHCTPSPKLCGSMGGNFVRAVPDWTTPNAQCAACS